MFRSDKPAAKKKRVCGTGNRSERCRIYVYYCGSLRVTSHRTLDVPGGCTTPRTTRVPAGTRRIPARVRTGTSSRSSSTPLVTSPTTPCTRLPTAWTGIWIVRAGGRGCTPCWTRRLHAHLSWYISTLDARYIRSRLNRENQIREFCLQLTESLHAEVALAFGCLYYGRSICVPSEQPLADSHFPPSPPQSRIALESRCNRTPHSPWAVPLLLHYRSMATPLARQPRTNAMYAGACCMGHIQTIPLNMQTTLHALWRSPMTQLAVNVE